MTPKLEVRSVRKSFTRHGETRAVLEDISFSVAKGEFVTILGASGCGKTTLLRVIDGLEEHNSGEILIDGSPQRSPGREQAFVFQQHRLFPWRTVEDNVALGLELRGLGRKERRRQAGQYLDLVGLTGYEDHYPHELSGGMNQRANLARALVVDPEVLLMDEPFAALDAQTREIMQRELLRIWRETGKTVLFVTHQLDEAVYLSDRVVVLTARPGTIREIIDVPFERPRALDIKRSRPFGEIETHIWRLIEGEVESAVLGEGASS